MKLQNKTEKKKKNRWFYLCHLICCDEPGKEKKTGKKILIRQDQDQDTKSTKILFILHAPKNTALSS